MVPAGLTRRTTFENIPRHRYKNAIRYIEAGKDKRLPQEREGGGRESIAREAEENRK